MRIADIRNELRSLGAKSEHETLILRAWAHGRPLETVSKRPVEGYFPASLLKGLPAFREKLASIAQLHSKHEGADGSSRLLLKLVDGKTVESVLLLRDGVCVSSQVGCAVGCAFCMTGRGGLERQLGSAEIVAQVALARTFRKVRKVVFMGMGEPSHNLANVLEAIEFLGTEGGLAHKQIVFSTVGDRRVFERLPAGQVKPALALSLHTTRADLRAKLLPRAPRIDPEELVELGEEYALRTGYPIQYQWTLLDGVNDNADEIEGIVRLLEGKYAILNLIPYNTVPGIEFRRPDASRAAEMARTLHRRRILTKIRQSAGQDVDGGCGQLRARALQTS